jgi:hypothetical protein
MNFSQGRFTPESRRQETQESMVVVTGSRSALRDLASLFMSVFSAQRPAHGFNAAGEAPHRRNGQARLGNSESGTEPTGFGRAQPRPVYALLYRSVFAPLPANYYDSAIISTHFSIITVLERYCAQLWRKRRIFPYQNLNIGENKEKEGRQAADLRAHTNSLQ